MKLTVLGVALLATVSMAAQNGFMAAGRGAGASAPNASVSKSKLKTPTAPGEEHVKDFSTGIRNGILTVDGMVGKAQMNYDIKQDFLYFTVPGVGTAIVAQQKFINALPQKDAFRGKSLTIQVNGHQVQLTNDGPIVPGKENQAWVAIDPLYGADIAFPQMGFGNTIQRPYVWPGSKEMRPGKDDRRAISAVVPPPLPMSIRPKPEVSSSYTVTMPAAAPVVEKGPQQ